MALSVREIRIRRILEQYGDSLFRLSFSYTRNYADSQEVVQDCMIQLLRYDPKFKDQHSEKAWLMKTCVNLSRNKLRFNHNHDTEELDERLAAEEDQNLSFVWDAVNQLSSEDREAIHLFYQEGYTTKQISELTGRNESTIRSRLKRAREQLKGILKEVYDFEE